ncbi:MAG: hypothetical protein JJT95_14145 [Pararhodobacter sp.]|nr:hypothetical protein [Pararhodobacter sp.]
MAEVILHLGAHGTDNGTISAWLDRNAAVMVKGGTLVMPARRFLQRLSQSLADLGESPGEADRRAFGDELGLGGHITRLAVSAPALLGPLGETISAEGFYARSATRRLHALGRLLPRDVSLTLALAIARPGAIVPALLAAEEPEPDRGAIEARLEWLPEETLPWATLVRHIRHELPRARMLVWRHESIPRIWPEVLSRLAGAGEDAEMTLPVGGAEDLAMQGIADEGRQRMRDYIARKPPPTPALMQRVAAAFAQGYGRTLPGAAGAAGDGIALPGAVRERLAQLDEGYAAQWSAIAGMDGVEALG